MVESLHPTDKTQLADDRSAAVQSEGLKGFALRHLGPRSEEQATMLKALGYQSLEQLTDACLPEGLAMQESFDWGQPTEEHEALSELKALLSQDRAKDLRCFVGMGYVSSHLPPVIQRQILENPAWYTAYTPYQAEIAQGRLEMLLSFQTMVSDLTGLEVANASLLDEATAAAEAMTLALRVKRGKGQTIYIEQNTHPQTVEVIRTRAAAIDIRVSLFDRNDTARPWEQADQTDPAGANPFAVLWSYPGSDGAITDIEADLKAAQQAKLVTILACDLLALTQLKNAADLGADIAIGSTQRFGLPIAAGGPHAAFLATHKAHARKMPGRVIGVSQDRLGRPALRMALQTREQHIRRDKATSNICTAQVLPAVIATAYAIYHGPEGLCQQANHIHTQTRRLAATLEQAGHQLAHHRYFDTIRVHPQGCTPQQVKEVAEQQHIELRTFSDGSFGITLDETTSDADLQDLAALFQIDRIAPDSEQQLAEALPSELRRDLKASPFCTHEVFKLYRSETELQRYLHRLANKDLSLVHSMIPLGSCTMKLNSAAEMMPVSWPEIGRIHPFSSQRHWAGFAAMCRQVEEMICDLTGFAGVSLQPNAGSQGEFAGLMIIRKYHEHRGEAHRNICLIPTSAHGTNPASAIMAGMKVVEIRCDDQGNVDLDHLREMSEQHAENLAALMITYPSTHGVFETSIRDICAQVHRFGGQVYLDGANLNALIGLCRPQEFGADVCHLNLHKTFCIPHGGGGPGVGPVGVAAHLKPHLPPSMPQFGHRGASLVSGHGLTEATSDEQAEKHVGQISAAPLGNAGVLPISWMYMKMMGLEGLKAATQVAILNANYMAQRLAPAYKILFTGAENRVAHECIIDLRPFKKSAGIEAEDIAKRLIDYGFHAPTMSWPVAGTIMIEPTESESKHEIDRFCDAMLSIREEIAEIENQAQDRQRNVLKNAPHPVEEVCADSWDHPYPRAKAAFPAEGSHKQKFWPSVARVDNAFGDRKLLTNFEEIPSS